MKRSIFRSATSRKDLLQILLYIRQGNARAARAMMARFHRALEVLSDFPGAGAERSELGRGLRSYPLGNYLLFYRATRTELRLVRVLHGARDLRRIFRR